MDYIANPETEKRALDSDEKLMDIAAQLRAAELGFSKVVTCPYCKGRNDFGGAGPPKLCCEKFGMAAVAVTAQQEQNELIDELHRIQDKAHGQAVFN